MFTEESGNFTLSADSPNTVLPPTPSQDDINTIFEDFKGFDGLININSITPNDVDLAALLSFFNNRRRPGLITAAPTTPLAGPESSETSAAQMVTTPSPASIDVRAPVGDDSDISDTTIPTIPTVSQAPEAATPESQSQEESITATTLTPSLSASLVAALTSPSPVQNETFAPDMAISEESWRAGDDAVHPSEMSSPPTEEPEAERVTPQLEALRNPEEGVSTGAATSTEEPLTLMSFLRRAGTNTQVIRTSSLNNVYEIIQTLPEGTTPIVLFR